MNMVSRDSSGSWVWAKGGRGKKELPWPFAGGVGVFSHEGFGHMRVATSTRKVIGMLFFLFGKMGLKTCFEGARESDDTVLFAFSVMDRDCSLAKINVFDAQAQGLHKSEA